jgi:5'-3' exonuclease
MFKSIFSWERDRRFASTYTATSMLLGDLRKVGLDKDDTVIIAVDSPKGSWRKDIDKQYKANRKARREEHKDIDWKKQFEDFRIFLEKIDMYSPFNVICIDKLEADDIIAYSCKYFKDKECIIVAADSDYEQLAAYSNVKLFSPIKKKYKKIENPYAILIGKINKETTDNLTSEILSEADFDKRLMLIDLIHLPEEIEKKVEEQIKSLVKKDWLMEEMPCYNSFSDRYLKIYDKDKVVLFEKKKRGKKEKEEKLI